MLHLLDTPTARIAQYRSQVESRIQRQQIVESQLHDLNKEHDEIKREIASFKALISEAKQHREHADLSEDSCDGDGEDDVRPRVRGKTPHPGGRQRPPVRQPASEPTPASTTNDDSDLRKLID
eukprot:9363796-Pyramimonas_sp.AAC.1